jgi:maleylacetoacetate isomerase
VKDPPFVPHDPEGRAHVLAMALTIACDIHPLNNLRVLKYLKAELGQEQEAVDAWYRHWVAEGLAALEALAAPRASRFLYGDTLSMADICLVPQLFNGRRFDVRMDAFPSLLRAEASALDLEAFQAAHPDRQEIQS